MTISVQRALADYFHYQAEWRREKANEYSEDERNLRSAAGLDELAGYVLGLSDVDERIRDLEKLVIYGGVASLGESARYAVSRFGFLDQREDADAFITQLVRLATEDALGVWRDEFSKGQMGKEQ
jgi:hypothetical protein